MLAAIDPEENTKSHFPQSEHEAGASMNSVILPAANAKSLSRRCLGTYHCLSVLTRALLTIPKSAATLPRILSVFVSF